MKEGITSIMLSWTSAIPAGTLRFGSCNPGELGSMQPTASRRDSLAEKRRHLYSTVSFPMSQKTSGLKRVFSPLILQVESVNIYFLSLALSCEIFSLLLKANIPKSNIDRILEALSISAYFYTSFCMSHMEGPGFTFDCVSNVSLTSNISKKVESINCQ